MSEDAVLRQVIKQGLQECHTLEAADFSETLRWLVSHSRPIHLLMADINIADARMVPIFNRYRPRMRVLLVSESALSATLENARELLSLPKRTAAGAA